MSPAISVKGVLIEDGAVLLLENERDEWELPGGRPEPGEDPAACLAREFAEELGAEIAVGGIIDCWNFEVLPGHHVMIVTYAVARAERGELRISDEHRQLGWFPLDAIGALKLPDGYRRSIRAVAALPGIEPAWLALARELQAMAQTGLHFTKDKYDAERFAQLRVLASRMMAMGSTAAAEQIVDLFSQDVGYATPRLDVRGAAFRDDRILMVRETSDGRWSLPGGWADMNLSPGENIAREIVEETGFSARAVKLASVWDRARHGHLPPHPYSIFKMFFLCELTGGAPTPSHETSEIGFFAEDALPELSPGRIQAHQIRRMFAHFRQPDLPTDFD